MTAEVLPAAVTGRAGLPSVDEPSGRGRLVRDFPSARDVLEGDLRYLTGRLVGEDRRLATGDQGGVHDLSLACGRIRALLECYHNQFDDDTVRSLVGELSWLMSRLGESRDLAVTQAYVESLPDAHESEALRFLARISQSRQFAAWDLGATRASRRYLEAVDLLAGAGASLRWDSRASGPWRAELIPGLQRAHAALRHAQARAEGADPSSIDEALGEVLERVRTLRYGTEVVEALDRPAYSPLVGRLIAVQEVLERHHDAVAVERVLQRGSRIIQDAGATRWLREARSLLAVAKADAVGDWYRVHGQVAALTY